MVSELHPQQLYARMHEPLHGRAYGIEHCHLGCLAQPSALPAHLGPAITALQRRLHAAAGDTEVHPFAGAGCYLRVLVLLGPGMTPAPDHDGSIAGWRHVSQAKLLLRCCYCCHGCCWMACSIFIPHSKRGCRCRPHRCRLVDDTAWHPMTKESLETMDSSTSGFYKFFLGTPLKLWASIGHWWIWHFDLSKYSEAQVRRDRLPGGMGRLPLAGGKGRCLQGQRAASREAGGVLVERVGGREGGRGAPFVGLDGRAFLGCDGSA